MNDNLRKEKLMEKIVALVAMVGLLIVTGVLSVHAQTAEQNAIMKICMVQELQKANDTRGGLSASEFCAAVAVSGG